MTNNSNAITKLNSDKVSNSFTENRALITDADGKVAVSPVTSTELSYLDGVASAIQTQLNARPMYIGSTQLVNTSIDGGTEGSYTATQDCWFTIFNFHATAEGLGAQIRLNGKFLLNCSCTSGVAMGYMPIKKGDVIKWNAAVAGSIICYNMRS